MLDVLGYYFNEKRPFEFLDKLEFFNPESELLSWLLKILGENYLMKRDLLLLLRFI